jgi:membrane protease YdiL (CAAX protease family)
MSTDSKTKLKWLVLIGLILPIFLQLFSHVIQSNDAVSQIAYILSKLLFITAPLLFWLLTRQPIVEPGGTHKKFSLVSGLALSISIFAVLYSVLELIRPFGATIGEALSVLGLTQNFLLYSALIIIFNSLLEELFWRYAIFGGLRQMLSLKWAMIISSLGFAGMHLMYYTGLFDSLSIILLLTTITFCFGMFWAWLYQKTKSIPHVWVNHMLVNVPLFYIEYLIIA